MRILVIGGSGYVGGLVVPRLAAAPYQHALTLFDRRAPGYSLPDGVAFQEGDITEVGGPLEAALPGHDAVLYLAMGGFYKDDRPATLHGAFDINAKAVWITCEAAVRHGVGRFVYASSLSIYSDPFIQEMPTEETPRPDALDLYGLTKRFGEECVRRFAETGEKRLSAFALRLCFPVETDAEVAATAAKGKDCGLTGAETARAFHAALTAPAPPLSGYAAVFVVGARAAHRVNMARARRLIDWAPDPLPE